MLVGLGPPSASLQVAGVHGQGLVAVVDGRVGTIGLQVALCTIAVKKDGRKDGEMDKALYTGLELSYERLNNLVPYNK